jgi:hypothetical protein
LTNPNASFHEALPGDALPALAVGENKGIVVKYLPGTFI